MESIRSRTKTAEKKRRIRIKTMRKMIIKKLLALIILIIVSLISCGEYKAGKFEIWQDGKIIDITCSARTWGGYAQGGVYYKYIGECDK